MEPGNDARVAAALAGAPFEIETRTIDQLRRRARKDRTTLVEAIETLIGRRGSAERSDGEEAAEVLGIAMALAEDGDAAGLIAHLDERLGLRRRAEADGDRALRTWDQAMGLVGTLIEQRAPIERIPDVLEMRTDEELARVAHDERRVLVQTMHVTKGEEHRHVMVVDWAEGEFPAPYKRTDVEEERRLALTTLTRASRTFHALVRTDAGDGQVRAPSRFLTEAGIQSL